jgi:hypothetical protein
MDLREALAKLDINTARSFVTTACRVVDALLVSATAAQKASTPPTRDYDQATLPRSDPPGGWLTHDELRTAAQRMAEAIAAEKWTEGVLLALKVLGIVGGVL